MCASLVGREDAEDAVQDAYLQARRAVRQLRDTATMEAWLYRIAINVCYGWHRRRRLHVELPVDVQTGDRSARDLGLVQLIEALPPRERTILVLHYGHGYGLDEIAEAPESRRLRVAAERRPGRRGATHVRFAPGDPATRPILRRR